MSFPLFRFQQSNLYALTKPCNSQGVALIFPSLNVLLSVLLSKESSHTIEVATFSIRDYHYYYFSLPEMTHVRPSHEMLFFWFIAKISSQLVVDLLTLNSLPSSLRQDQTDTFKKGLKTYLFTEAFKNS